MAVVIMVCSLIRIPVGLFPSRYKRLVYCHDLLDLAESFFLCFASRFEDYYRWMGCRYRPVSALFLSLL